MWMVTLMENESNYIFKSVEGKYAIIDRVKDEMLCEFDSLYKAKQEWIKLNKLNKTYPKHICFNKRSTKYFIEKVINNKKHYFGTYSTLEEAEYEVKRLKENNWNGLFNKKQSNFYHNIRFHHNRNFPYEVYYSTDINKKKYGQSMACYSCVEDALFDRDRLIECDWDYEVFIETVDDAKPNPYYYQVLPPFPESWNRKKSGRKKSNWNLPKGIYLRDNGKRYRVIQWINNKEIYHGSSKSLKTAKKILKEKWIHKPDTAEHITYDKHGGGYRVYYNHDGKQDRWGLFDTYE